MSSAKSTPPCVDSEFLDDVIRGLSGSPKTLPCKYLYDARGCELFDRICDLDEYYPTRTEIGVMERHAADMAACIGPRAMLVELGSGSALKTRVLLDQLEDPVAYVPVDIAGDHLQEVVDDLTECFAGLEVLPQTADFSQPFDLPTPERTPDRIVFYFPGSTIGNFSRQSAGQLLSRIGRLAGAGGGLVIGVDLQKDVDVLEAAYDDAEGVTAAFNVNLLTRINRELGADFAVDRFCHRARYNESAGRIEMHLESRGDQTVRVNGHQFQLTNGETICTEHSHKYTPDGFRQLLGEAGFATRQTWCDDRRWFAIFYGAVANE